MNETDIRRLDLSLLLVFRELVRLRRTTEVASRLNLSQSAVSHALGRLREIAQDPLFTRRPDGLTPTARAVELLPKVETMIALAHELAGGNAAFDAKTTTRTFQISSHDMAMALIVAPLLRRVREAAPSARIAMRAAVGGRALALLERGEIDVAFGTFAALPFGCMSTHLLSERFIVVARKGHPALKGGMSLDLYLALDHLLVSFRAGFVGRVDTALQKQGLHRRVVASVPTFFAALAAVAGTDLIATAPKRLSEMQADQFGLAVYECPVSVEPFDILAVRHKSCQSDAGIDWLIDLAAAPSL